MGTADGRRTTTDTPTRTISRGSHGLETEIPAGIEDGSGGMKEMKKSLGVTLVAFVLVFAFAPAAFAAKGSVMVRTGDATSTASLLATYNDWSGTSTSTALATFPGNAGSSSPHSGYATATVKCAACHAVHVAAPAGDTLLRMKASDSCVYCHVATGSSVSGAIVYGGDPLIPARSGDDHHTVGGNCSVCHASVHGSNAIKDVPSLTGLLLKRDANSRAVNLTAMADLLDPTTGLSTRLATVNDTATRRAAVGIWCGSCHNNAYYVLGPSRSAAFGYAGTATAGTWSIASGTAGRTGHRVEALASDNWNVGNSISTSAKTSGRIAWAPATDCQSCHDASNGLTGVSAGTGFPHYTPNATRFLNVASSVVATAAPSGVNQPGATGIAGTEHARMYSLKDGVCLKCHRGTDTTGVGFDY